MIPLMVERIRLLGIREVSRRSGVPPSTIVDRLREPGSTSLGEFFNLVAAVGAGVQLIVPPTPLERRRSYVRRVPPPPPQPEGLG